jgi:3-phenylpropionate/cinnamic acid dioxygenase small subunit
MKRLLQLAVVVLACLAQIACTSFRVVTDSQAASTSAMRSTEPPLAPKDVALITTTDGRQLELRVISVDANSATGTTDGSKEPTVIPVEQIQRVERSEVDGTRCSETQRCMW